MGTELIIAVGALVLALVAFSLTQGQSRHIEAEAKANRRARDELGKELESRIDAIDARLHEKQEGNDQVRQLRATVKVLELRALEHDALLCSLVTEDEAHHLWNVSRDEPTRYHNHDGVAAELRSLVRRGLLRKKGQFKIHELPGQFELHDHFSLSDSGEMLLALRKHLKVSDTRVQDSLPPPAVASPESGPALRRSAPPPFIRPTGS